MSTVKIGSRLVGYDQPCFVIAEIGINHNGDLSIAKQLIDLAVETGCDAVKFQKRTVDVVYTAEELARSRENPFGETNGDLKNGLELGLVEYQEIDRYCSEKNISWLVSCWDEASVDFFDQFDIPCFKIASASLTDENLLRHTSSKGKPIILSTGMSTMDQVVKAIDILGQDDLIVLHCTSTYPSDEKELNLSVIKFFQDFFPNIPIGYSGHEKSVKPSIYAACFGACVVERHITLDRTMWGSDQAASLGPQGLEVLVSDIRIVEQVRGDGYKILLESEIPVMEKLRRKTDF